MTKRWNSEANRAGKGIEWPTLAVAIAIYASFTAVVLLASRMHPVLIALAGGWVVAWHGSLQHEIVHGHPTPWPRFNRLLVLPCLWLWLPFEDYRRTHLHHHGGVGGARLTVPGVDPETPYLRAEHYARLPALARAWLQVERSLLGALLLRPVRQPLAYALELCRTLRSCTSDAALATRTLHMLALHGIGCAIPLGFAWWFGDISPAEYLLLFVYPGLALTTLRSFGEHSWNEQPAARSNITHCAWPFALLFLNNNLHAVHHREPGLAWYRIPARLRELQAREYTGNDGNEQLVAHAVFNGYGDVARRFGLRPRMPVEFPGE